VGQVRADEAEGLGMVPAFELVDFFDRLLVHQVAADPVIGVGRVDDDPPLTEGLGDFPNQPQLGVLGVDAEQHGRALQRFMRW
jgi:hypothetical protein